MKTKVSAIVCNEIEKEIEAPNEKEAGINFFMEFGVAPEFIGGRAVIGVCENCLNPILEGELYGWDENGIYLCELCGKEI